MTSPPSRFAGLQQYKGLEVRDDNAGQGSLFFDPRTGRTYRVTDGHWEDVSLLYPVDDIIDCRIRWQNMHRGMSNYMPKMPPPLPEPTQDIDYEEV